MVVKFPNVNKLREWGEVLIMLTTKRLLVLWVRLNGVTRILSTQ
jgi:hypothetical protein